MARQVAKHKSTFVAEKEASGRKIDHFRAISGVLGLIPEGASLVALGNDYAAMREDGLLALNPMTFAELMEHRAAIQNAVNCPARPRSHFPAPADARHELSAISLSAGLTDDSVKGEPVSVKAYLQARSPFPCRQCWPLHSGDQINRSTEGCFRTYGAALRTFCDKEF